MPYTNIWLTPQQHKIASSYAKETKDSLAGVIRKALNDYLEITPIKPELEAEKETEAAQRVETPQPETPRSQFAPDNQFFNWQKERMDKEQVSVTEAINEPDPYKQRSLLDRLFKKDKDK